jgi:hypothetical protein
MLAPDTDRVAFVVHSLVSDPQISGGPDAAVAADGRSGGALLLPTQ